MNIVIQMYKMNREADGIKRDVQTFYSNCLNMYKKESAEFCVECISHM